MRREELEELVRPLLDQEGFELVEYSVSRHQRSQAIRLSVDREEGVGIDACARLSREISDLLDARPFLHGAYQLEVSSAGMHRPIWKPEHYRRFQGDEVRLDLGEGASQHRILRGTIGQVLEDGVWILPSKGEGRLVGWGEIERAHLHRDPWKKRPGQAARTPEQVGTSQGPHEPAGARATRRVRKETGTPEHGEYGDGRDQ